MSEERDEAAAIQNSVIEVLDRYHDRKAFDCGKASLNDYLQKTARQHAERNLGVTHVVVPAPGASRIMGYYTLTTRIVERNLVPEKHLPTGDIGVVLLGRLAVDVAFQGHGLGRRMLLRAVRQTEIAAREIGIYALTLDALDEEAHRWYLSLNWGFASLQDNERHLYLPISTIRALGLGESP